MFLLSELSSNSRRHCSRTTSQDTTRRPDTFMPGLNFPLRSFGSSTQPSFTAPKLTKIPYIPELVTVPLQRLPTRTSESGVPPECFQGLDGSTTGLHVSFQYLTSGPRPHLRSGGLTGGGRSPGDAAVRPSRAGSCINCEGGDFAGAVIGTCGNRNCGSGNWDGVGGNRNCGGGDFTAQLDLATSRRAHHPVECCEIASRTRSGYY